MDARDALVARAVPVTLDSEETSYLAMPATILDPFLFHGDTLRPELRTELLGVIHGFLAKHYALPLRWCSSYIAGSGASYLWTAARDPGDLDVLLVVDYVNFRQQNPRYADLTDGEIAADINERLHSELWPATANWHGYETTFYVNEAPMSQMHPYAAVSIDTGEWLVHPDTHPTPNTSPEVMVRVAHDTALATELARRYDDLIAKLNNERNPGARVNHKAMLDATVLRAISLYHDIHEGRRKAFIPSGLGFSDPAESRYKNAKASGALKALKTIASAGDAARSDFETQTYGAPLDDTNDIIRRTMLRQP